MRKGQHMVWFAFALGVVVGASGFYAFMRFVLSNWSS